MLNSTKDFLEEQEILFDQYDDYAPRINKIKESGEIGRKILDFIDKEITNIDMETFHNIDTFKIVEELEINKNKELDGDILSDIYKEIDETFKKGGRVSLEDYLAQGTIILNDMLNSLKGLVDYSIDYSERQLKEEERKAFERFNLVMSLQNLKETAFCFNLSPAGKTFLVKAENYLNLIHDIPVAKTIEEKLGEINNFILMTKTMEDLNCPISNKIELNNFFSDKVNDIVKDISIYREDSNIKKMFLEVVSLADKYSDNEVITSMSNKLDLINEKLFEKVYDKKIDKEL